MSTRLLDPRPAGTAAGVGGTAVTVLGLAATVDPDLVGNLWFAVAGLAVGLLVIGVLGLRRAAAAIPLVRAALAPGAVALALFGLAHFYALVDADRAVVLFSIFMVLSAIALIVGGAALVRGRLWSGWRRAVPLLCGVWPLATIPAGSALGDVPHFLAIAGWGLCWVGLGVSLLTVRARQPVRA